MRIASLSPAATEILFALGMGKDIVCTDQFSNFPDDAKAIAHLRDHQKVDPASLREFAPDIVFTGTVIQQKLAEQLRGAGFSVIFQDPRTIHDIYESIRQIGTIVSAEPQAEALVLSMQQGFNAVKKKATLLPSHPKVYVEEWPALAGQSGRHQSPMASGNWVPETVRLAGGIPFPIPPGQLSREVTLQEVAAFDPDLAVISWCGAGALADKNIFLERKGWENLRVIRENRVRVIDDSLLNRPGPRLVEGAQRLYGWVFEMLH